MNDQFIPAPLERVITGVPGLDRLTHGGLLRAGIYLVLGSPGAGKTVLSNHIVHHHVSGGGRAVYLTLLSESHARMLSHVQSFDFFRRDIIGDGLVYVSGYQALEQKNLTGLLTMVRRTIIEHRATMLVIDGIVTAGSVADSELLLKKFIHELKAHVELVGCTVLMLTSTPAPGTHYPAQTMVDGILRLSTRRDGLRAVREVEISKFRGSDFMSGGHFFEITQRGIEIHPRFEAVLTEQPLVPGDAGPEVAGFGIAGFDQMLGGGVAVKSTTLLLGASGSGKTSLGLRFLAEGIAKGERGVFVGFYEAPSRLLGKASTAGDHLVDAVAEGELAFMWRPSLELIADQFAEEVLALVERLGAKRLVIDGIEALARSVVMPERAPKILGALAGYLRVAGVTALLTQEPERHGDDPFAIEANALTAVAENIVILRYDERQGHLCRQVCVLKMRDTGHDDRLREFRLTHRGFEIVDPATPAEDTVPSKGART